MREHRKYSRKPLHPPVAFRLRDEPPVEAECRDISLGGMFIETPTPAPFGAEIEVLLTLPGLDTAALIRAVVRWTDRSGMGLQFGPMGARATHALTELLAKG